ncbi:hypothetical protein [Mangrovicoccus ximenensis]|uniref:hypothetical protein n=1 Tax=Mangrovicoccus ximenensis TaxID=1911570 RepID=UPI001F3793AF|nr:hypothetical protein [Mangrovicoccus ximenensis]
MVQFSARTWNDLKEIRAFLFQRMYHAAPVMKKREEADHVIRDLFPLYMSHPDLLPERWHARALVAQEARLARMVADYVAGMTDRYALQAHREHCAEPLKYL